MASMWRRAMLYLGLGPDDEYDDFDVTGEHQRPARRARPCGVRRPRRAARSRAVRLGAHAPPDGRRRPERLNGNGRATATSAGARALVAE